MQIRGGSSKGVYFHRGDLPQDMGLREQVLLAAMAGVDARDPRQIDGLGGAHPLTSKVAVVGPSLRDDADIDYLFVQVVVGEGRVDITPNCGNILAGVGPYALERGLVAAADTETLVRVHMENTGKLCELTMQTPQGRVTYAGDARIDGVPGTAAPIICNFLDVAGSVCGALLPTGNVLDTIDSIAVTCIDNGMPVVVVRAESLGVTGYETVETLNGDDPFKQRLESLRLQAGAMMGLGDVSRQVIPKVTLIAAPQCGGDVCTRSFIPHVCHSAIGVLGAVSVGTACVLPGSVAQDMLQNRARNGGRLSLEHPSGECSVELTLDGPPDAPQVGKAGVLRTARLISRGEVFIPE
ncbi:4-oxalomesaconate tautomerase [Exilibacterium tricleocarpae]|uniref:4-oxalomesaconate tautomerase n=2 Tax=Exilibacterium tricleocarpae TaxID=2591008 RepID=A0A545T685_9GAMM|nr:4-oxalomesaconate tautomerase [Exilibacterium tricleocarpae]